MHGASAPLALAPSIPAALHFATLPAPRTAGLLLVVAQAIQVLR